MTKFLSKNIHLELGNPFAEPDKQNKQASAIFLRLQP